MTHDRMILIDKINALKAEALTVSVDAGIVLTTLHSAMAIGLEGIVAKAAVRALIEAMEDEQKVAAKE